MYRRDPWRPTRDYVGPEREECGFRARRRLCDQQPIGAFALSYRPRAGGGNAGTVAEALDLATPPPQFRSHFTAGSYRRQIQGLARGTNAVLGLTLENRLFLV